MLIVVVLLGLSLAQTMAGRTFLQSVGLYKPPGGFTALAFTDPGNIPDRVPHGNTSIGVSFGIRNATDASRTYDWSIALVHSGKSQVGASGVATVPAQGQTTISRAVAAACTGGRLQVIVRLASPAESIDFWVTCPAKARSMP